MRAGWLRHMLATLDASGVPAYLDTLEEDNLPIYEHLGFDVADESTVPGTGLTLWAMLRHARP